MRRIKNPLISTIVTTKNEEKNIGRLLKSLKSQSYKNIEIVVVDHDETTDNTAKIASRYTDKVYIKGPERSNQRNFGVKKARGEFVLILDADMILSKNVLKECAYKLNKKSDLGGLIIPEKSFGEGYWAKCKAFEREFYVGEESIEAARCFKRSIFLKFEGYDAEITGPEDYDLPLRIKKAGIKIGRIRSYILHNEGKLSLLSSAKKKLYYAAHSRSYFKKHPEMAIKQGNLLFRPVFFKKWRKLMGSPVLALGMFLMRILENSAALLGIIFADQIKRKNPA